MPVNSLAYGVLFSLLCISAAQSGVNGTNSTNCTNGTNGSSCNATNVTKPCITEFCDTDMRIEALYSCKEYIQLNFPPERCSYWQDAAFETCSTTCSDCNVIGKAIYQQCTFLMQTYVGYDNAVKYCTATGRDFVNARCAAATVDRILECQSREAVECNRICGNFANCWCYKQRLDPTRAETCEGQTILTGPVPGRPGLEWNCYQTLAHPECSNAQAGTRCGKYKHCPVDLCVVKNISCPTTDPCQGVGVCIPETGTCSYTEVLDGTLCDDGIPWTFGDKCKRGRCTGIENKCVRYNISCKTVNSCLVPTKNVPNACEPLTGACLFELAKEGSTCPNWPGQAIAKSSCVAGLCRSPKPSLCSGVVCPDPNGCQISLYCEESTGNCLPINKPEGTPCDDGDSRSARDQCIEGRCIGDKFGQDIHFDSLGKGPCEGRVAGVSPGAKRYSGDTKDSWSSAPECQAQCEADPECVAFSFGLHSCSIYGTTRRYDPPASRWNRSWTLEEALPVPAFDVWCWAKQRGALAFADIVNLKQGSLLNVSITVLLIIPGCFLVFIAGASYKTGVLTIIGCEKPAPVEGMDAKEAYRLAIAPDMNSYKEDGGPPGSPRGGMSAIAAAPQALEEEQPQPESDLRDPRGEVEAHEGEGEAQNEVHLQEVPQEVSPH